METLKILSYILIFIFQCHLALAESKEAFSVEGTIGQLSGSSIYDLTEEKYQPSGLSTYLRFHLPIYQKDNFIFRLSLSNQFLDSNNTSPITTGQTNYLISSGLGLGFNTQWRFLIFGAEYQQDLVRQMIVGTNTTHKSYTLGLPVLYAGLIFRLGTLGIGTTYLYKKGQVTAQQSGLASDHDFEEKSIQLNFIIYFFGSTSGFFRSLFSK